jgi:MYXO-CTERM domain-containing protein
LASFGSCLGFCLAAASCVEPPATAEQDVLDVCAVANDGDLCDDHQACTYPDACLNKKCVGMPVVDGTRCTDGNVCTINDHCVMGVCVATVQPDGASCTDGDPCTDPDICQQGVCLAGAPLVCDDANACTIDSCEPGVGCLFSPRDCALPPDAGPGPDAVAPDAPAPDTGADGVVDAVFDAVVDLGVDLGVGDSSSADGQTPDALAIDTGTDTGAPDAGAPDAGDGAFDAEPGTFDAGLDLPGTPPDLRVRGGGCACAVGPADRDQRAVAWIGAALSLVAMLFRRRRRR